MQSWCSSDVEDMGVGVYCVALLQSLFIKIPFLLTIIVRSNVNSCLGNFTIYFASLILSFEVDLTRWCRCVRSGLGWLQAVVTLPGIYHC